ncbi:MAG TPA: excinuclease ABC subunit UvrC [Clostridia bacterium]|nr:excinuclease ABC subunit UvrC [Clostridia bacterium]
MPEQKSEVRLEEKLKLLPALPGVYLFKDEKGKVIYVGKAISLKNRVRSYFTGQQSSPKTQVLVKKIRDLDYLVTDSEVEALILESNLIKKHKPKYNIRLMDDKNYPYLRVTVQEKFPRLEMVRSVKRDGARYFGPYTNVGALHETLRLLKRVFPLRSCKQKDFSKQERACLNAHIKRCAAPCQGLISEADYRKMIEEVILFLEGRQEKLAKTLKKRMQEAAKRLDFEKAAELRDQLQAVENVIEKQKIVSTSREDYDVLHYARANHIACVQLFFVRSGKVSGGDHFLLEGLQGTEDAEILPAFLKQYYHRAEFIPPQLILPEKVEEQEVLETWLKEKRGSKVVLTVPQRGHKKELLALGAKNARENLQRESRIREEKERQEEKALQELADYLGLSRPLQRMECYDISNIKGREAVASMVVFEKGRANPSAYRRFKIKTVEGPDDFASMAEVIRRRFSNAQSGNPRFLPLPDLVVVDGGKGQLSAVCGVMRELGYGDIPAVGLAKQEEWVFMEGKSDPLILPRDSQGLYLLQRIRDEAHRFAITYHRLLRGKRNLLSVLDEIPGLGPKRKAALLKHFQLSLQKIRQASLEELEQVEGLGKKAAWQIWNYFQVQEEV